MNKTLTLQTVAKDKSTGSLPIRSILELDNTIKTQKNNGLIYKSKFYRDYDHGGVSFVAENDALPFTFDFYGINFPFLEFFNPAFKNV